MGSCLVIRTRNNSSFPGLQPIYRHNLSHPTTSTTTNPQTINVPLIPKPRHNLPRTTLHFCLPPTMKRTNSLPTTLMLRMHRTQWAGRQMLRNIQHKTPSRDRSPFCAGHDRVFISIPPLPRNDTSIRGARLTRERTNDVGINAGVRLRRERAMRRCRFGAGFGAGF